VPGDPPLRVWTTVAVCETEEADFELAAVFRGVDEAVIGVADALPAAVPSPPEADVVAGPDPPVAAPEITPVYVALKAETAARTLDGIGAMVPALYLLHCEVFKSLMSASAIPYASSHQWHLRGNFVSMRYWCSPGLWESLLLICFNISVPTEALIPLG
jgi:hypothetical protein